MPQYFHPFPILKTQRLCLDKITTNDSKELLFSRSDSKMNEFIKRIPPKNIAEIEAFIHKTSTQRDEGSCINWKISLKENPRLIGNICLWNITNNRKTAEVGYDLHTQYQGKGLMTEALQKVIEYGFEMMKLDKIVAYTDYRNQKSIALLTQQNFIIQPKEKDEDNMNNRIFALENNNSQTN